MEHPTLVEKKFLEALKEDVVNLEIEGIKNTTEEALKAGINPVSMIIEGLASGIDIIGEKFEKGECYLSDLVLATEVVKDAMGIIQPYIKGGELESKGKVILATVKGDNHDIGKSLVATLLRVSGFDVIDLGIDVPTEKIIEAVRIHTPNILGLSALLTVTMPEIGKVINGLEDSGLRNEVKLIIGGSPITKEFAEKIGADHNAIDAVEGVNKCIEWVTKGPT
jgi:5-methyltetrahydrofolate--homocysteine methyltransferase